MNRNIKKRIMSRKERLYYDFLPAMNEIIERPTNKLASVVLYLCFTLIILAVIWAGWAKTDIVVTASGYVDTENPIVTVNSLTDGIVDEIYVKDGDRVNEGDVLCTLVSEIDEKTLNEYERSIDILNIQKEVYETLYKKYKEDDYTTLEVVPEDYGDNSKIVEAIVLENEVFLDGLKNLKQSDKESAKRSQLLALIENINKIDVKLESTKTELEKEKIGFEYKKITAALSGVITLREKLYRGKILKSTEAIGYIGNDVDSYKFVAYIQDDDITEITTDDVVRLKLSAYDDTEYEEVEGIINKVEKMPTNIEGIGACYAVDINLSEMPEDIRPGMEGRVDLVVGSRTVLEYFLEPFKKGLEESLKEK